LTLFLCGDVMTGRGIDQVLPHPCPPHLMEPYVTSARQYVELAEQANGPIRKPVDFPYIWGEALAELDRVRPDLRIVNLETAVTTSEDSQPKGINYRMHPKNIPCITAAEIDCCLLGNNHVLDWGHAGLLETLASLETEGIETAGAGRDIEQAEAPAILAVPGKGRVIVFSFGDVSSGVPRNWAASADRPGINLLPDFSEKTAARIAGQVKGIKRPGGRRHRPRPFLTPSEGDRNLQAKADPLRLRRFRERLRRHRGIRGIQGRSGTDVFSELRAGKRKAGGVENDAPADQKFPAEPPDA
jgi:poly-gamma-glutamate synthesis protein (capsule biosynthesis protein)